MVDLSIIIVNWNTKDLLEQCLSSVYAATRDISFEVFVVDNASSDGSVDMTQERYPQVKLIANEVNVGFARANNQAIRLASGLYVLLLNSDTEVLPGALQTMVEFMDSHPYVGTLGACLYDLDGNPQPCYGRFPTLLSETVCALGFNKRWPFLGHDGHGRWTEGFWQVDWVSGACMLLRRKIINEVGMLDERYHFYSEEIDWAYRTKKRGWDIVALPSAQIIHLGGASSRWAKDRMLPDLYRSKIIFFRQNYGLLGSFVLRGVILGAALARVVLYPLLQLLTEQRQGRVKAWLRVASTALTSY